MKSDAREKMYSALKHQQHGGYVYVVASHELGASRLAIIHPSSDQKDPAMGSFFLGAVKHPITGAIKQRSPP